MEVFAWLLVIALIVSIWALNLYSLYASWVKGRKKLAVAGVFCTPFAWYGAFQYAFPGSRWYRKRYDAEKRRRADQRHPDRAAAWHASQAQVAA
jgi:hypothetical protein